MKRIPFGNAVTDTGIGDEAVIFRREGAATNAPVVRNSWSVSVQNRV
ncbi:MAG TPA: hypothetical protein VK210_13730 [Terriglobia bacterium]|nr:hypothetical protein [Terriglobia bacterium]